MIGFMRSEQMNASREWLADAIPRYIKHPITMAQP
jgi:hypothetical protein